MRITTRTVSAAAGRGMFLTGLFAAVIILQVGLVTGLAALGVPAGYGLFIAGAAVLLIVLAVTRLFNVLVRRDAERAERLREDQRLPDGACCVIWRGAEEGDIPWVLDGPIRTLYPPIARRYGIEGYALVDFELSADGRPKNPHLVDVWPARVFYEAAVEALAQARFKPKAGAAPRFGASYRMPFVFRIAGAAKLRRLKRRRVRIRTGVFTKA